MSRAYRIVTTFACAALLAVAAGCAVEGTPAPAEIDVRTLDTGSYPVDRYTYGRDSNGKGAVLEGMRMADAVVPAVKVDPSLRVGRGGIVLTSVNDVVTVSHLSSSARPVLQNRGFIAGFATSSSDLADPAGSSAPDPKSTTVTIRLLRFPSADSAKLAARELSDADFNVALDQNRKLTLPDYPDAMSHWRPGVANIGMTMPRKEFVISVFISRPSADQADLLSWLKKTLDAEVPAVDAFAATPADRVEQLPVDPDRLLARVLTTNRDGRSPDPDTFAVFGPAMLVHPAGDQALRSRLVADTGMDAMAGVDENYLFRTRDAKSGADLVSGLISSLGETGSTGPGPENVPDAKCVHRKSGAAAFRCYVIYKRYVGVVNAQTADEVHRMAAAQYALLANSL
ncbi:hypothetical protein [Nocardia sp. NPDC057668]|uniref:DUF7373 family lipoprotein n=1 Tax=Nocardia sp. NPDC057668 TaxID=3346202 RepID=UPI00366F7366